MVAATTGSGLKKNIEKRKRVEASSFMKETIESLDNQFADLHNRSVELLSRLSPELLYERSGKENGSCGEHILRSAAGVEQSFGGLLANLWDDPFEWTLPESLNTTAKVLEYLAEVEATRRRAFAAFESDADLAKEIAGLSGTVQLLPFLLDTLQRARHHQQRALAAFELLKTENRT